MKTRINRMLREIGYHLMSDIYGWIVVNNVTREEHRFSTLGGVRRFIQRFS